MLYKVADTYDEEVAVLTESLVSLLEPLMIVIPGRHGRFHRDGVVHATGQVDHRPVRRRRKKEKRVGGRRCIAGDGIAGQEPSPRGEGRVRGDSKFAGGIRNRKRTTCMPNHIGNSLRPVSRDRHSLPTPYPCACAQASRLHPRRNAGRHHHHRHPGGAGVRGGVQSAGSGEEKPHQDGDYESRIGNTANPRQIRRLSAFGFHYRRFGERLTAPGS